MLQHIRVPAVALCVLSIIFFGVSRLPPLTLGGSFGPMGIPQEKYDAAYRSELGYCRENLEATDCRCFGGISGLIQANDPPPVPGARQMNTQDLARWQAEDSC